MDVSEIRDEDSLRAWLEGRSREDAVAISFRSAARVLPLYLRDMGEAWSPEKAVTSLPVLRALMTAEVAQREPAAEVMAAALTLGVTMSDHSAGAYSAAAARAAAYASGLNAAGIHAVYDSAARAVSNATDAAAAARVGISSATEAAGYTAAIWTHLRNEAEVLERRGNVFVEPLWNDEPPKCFSSTDSQARAFWSKNPKTWEFWVRWWDGVIAGKPLDWELQKQVALIPDGDWQKGPEHIAELIRDIEARDYLDQIIRENPYAWRIKLNHRTGIFFAVAIEKRDLSAVVSDVRSAINDFHLRCKKLSVGNFGQSAQLAFKPVIEMLRRDLRRHSDHPLALFKAIEAAKTEMQTIAEVEGFAGESYISRFFATLEDNAEDICIASPDIVEQLKAKAALRYDLWDAERKRAKAVQTLALHLDSEGILKRASFLALATIQNPNSTDEERKEAWYFMTANLPRAARAYLADKAEHGEASVRSKKSMAKRVVEWADAFSKLDKGKDAILEAYSQIPEGVDLVRSIFESLLKN